MKTGPYLTDYHVHTCCGARGRRDSCDYVRAALERAFPKSPLRPHPVYSPGRRPRPGSRMTRGELPGYVEEVPKTSKVRGGSHRRPPSARGRLARRQEAALKEILTTRDVVLGSVYWVVWD
jgi:hypothetical protein